jgi:hypothetical protein
MRIAVPLLLFAFQIGAIVYARFVPSRYFCWAPYDRRTDYVATATVNGEELTAAAFQKRYRLPTRGHDNRFPQHVIDRLEQVEQERRSLGEAVVIELTYRVNGKEPPVEWHWPPTSLR